MNWPVSRANHRNPRPRVFRPVEGSNPPVGRHGPKGPWHHAWILIIVGAFVVFTTSCGVSRKHLSPEPQAPGDWTTIRGASDNSGVAYTDGPLRIDTLLWQYKTGGVATTEPIIAGGLLYYSSRDRRLEILNAATGKRLLRERYQGPVTGVLPGDTLFACTTDQNERHLFLYSYDPVDQLARIDIPISGCPPRRLSDGSILIAGMHGDLVCIGPDGEVKWSVKADGLVTSSVTVADSLFLVSAGRTVSARRVADGSVVWSHLSPGAVRAAPSVSDGMAFFGSTDSLVYAVTLNEGAMKWFFATRGQVMTSPTVGPDRVYLAANDQLVYALDRTTGRKVWSYNTGAPANTEPTLAGNTLIISTQKGKLLFLNAATGTLEQEFHLSAPASTAPVVANNRVYVADVRRQLYCFGSSREEMSLRDSD